MSSPASLLLSLLPPPAREAVAGLGQDALDDLLGRLLASGRGEWPGMKLLDEQFLRYLAERLPAGPEAASALRGVHAADLFLACGCAVGAPGALVQLDRRFLHSMR